MILQRNFWAASIGGHLLLVVSLFAVARGKYSRPEGEQPAVAVIPVKPPETREPLLPPAVPPPRQPEARRADPARSNDSSRPLASDPLDSIGDSQRSEPPLPEPPDDVLASSDGGSGALLEPEPAGPPIPAPEAAITPVSEHRPGKCTAGPGTTADEADVDQGCTSFSVRGTDAQLRLFMQKTNAWVGFRFPDEWRGLDSQSRTIPGEKIREMALWPRLRVDGSSLFGSFRQQIGASEGVEGEMFVRPEEWDRIWELIEEAKKSRSLHRIGSVVLRLAPDTPVGMVIEDLTPLTGD